MRKLLQQSPFLQLYQIFLFFGILLIVFFDKGELFLFVNQHHTPFLDEFFKYITFLGDGLFVVILGAILLFVNFGKSALALISLPIAGGIALFMKRVLFPEIVRPSKYFTDIDLHFVNDVVVHSSFSFPSGHSATAFALFCLLSLMFNNKWISLFLFFIAFLVGYSRIYLAQHFFTDVLAGSLIGVTSALILYSLIYQSDKFTSSRISKSSFISIWKSNG